MKITIGGTTYTEIKSLSFSPETDVTGDAVPINEFSVDIKTTGSVGIGQYAYLYDDLNNLWAKYWIIYAEHTDKYTIHVEAQSALKLLERRMLDPVMYSAEPVANILADVFYELGATAYEVDSSFASLTVTGFCPLQSAKTRLQWVCFVIGAYVKSFFAEKVGIFPVNAVNETLIPIHKTFWKPKVMYKDYVTAINIKFYEYVQGTPTTTDTWVTDGTNYYIQTEHNFKLSNPDAPASVLTHEITIEGITIVNQSNVSAITSHLSTYYFKRQEVDLDVINNAEYIPGERVIVYTDEDQLAVGFINSCSFGFGVQARSSIHMTSVEVRESAKLTVLYKYEDMQLGKAEYTLPVSYVFAIENPYLDLPLPRHRYIFRPLTSSATGTMIADGVTVTVQYEIALDYNSGESGAKILRIASVDGVEQDQTYTDLVEIT